MSVGSPSGLHLVVTGPMDVPRLARELALTAADGRGVPGGQGGHAVTELVLALAPLVGRLDLVTLDTGLEEPIELHGGGVRLAIGPYRPRARTRGKDLFAVERAFVADRILAYGPSAVSAHWTYEYGLGALDAGAPTLITVHDWAPTILRHARDRYRSVRLLMQMMAFAKGRHFAAVSPYMARKVERVTRRPCPVLPNMLNPEWFATELPAVPKIPRVLAVNTGFGRLKNVQRLLTAWPAVLNRVSAAELVLVGPDYEVEGPAHQWARERHFADGVTFMGPVPRAELPELIRSAAVFAHPSMEESFGMVVLEAMASGIPVLGGNRSGAVPWLLEEGAGALVDVKRPSSLAEGLLRLLEDPERARRTARRGYDRALKKFTRDAVASAYLERLDALPGGGQ